MSIGTYFKEIYKMGRSIAAGMRITLKYFLRHKETKCTIQYPRERDPIPPRHRGIPYLETEKCILCLRCKQACPVNCIQIEGFRANDGTYPAGFRGQRVTLTKFTVDYTLCIFCGLCEEACPQKCLFLGPGYSLLATDRRGMEKNLLTDSLYTEEDEAFVRAARAELSRRREKRGGTANPPD